MAARAGGCRPMWGCGGGGCTFAFFLGGWPCSRGEEEREPSAPCDRSVADTYPFATGKTSRRFYMQLPPPVEVGRRPLRGGGGGSGRGNGWGAVGRVGLGGGGPGGAIWAGDGGHRLPLPPLAPNHTITINLTLTFAAGWLGHASHDNWAAQDPPKFVHGCLCHMIALHFGPQHSF